MRVEISHSPDLIAVVSERIAFVHTLGSFGPTGGAPGTSNLGGPIPNQTGEGTYLAPIFVQNAGALGGAVVHVQMLGADEDCLQTHVQGFGPDPLRNVEGRGEFPLIS